LLMEDGQQARPAEGGGTSYRLINEATGAVVGAYRTKARARLWRDRRDSEHGAYVHRIDTMAMAMATTTTVTTQHEGERK